MSYSNLVATFALVVAIAGGVAFAAGGQRSPAAKPVVVRQAAAAVEPGERERLLKLPGIGKFEASRGEFGPSGGVRLTNTTNRRLEISYIYTAQSANPQASPGGHPLEPGEDAYFGLTSLVTSWWVSIYPANPNKAAPQAEVLIQTSPAESRLFVLSAKG